MVNPAVHISPESEAARTSVRDTLRIEEIRLMDRAELVRVQGLLGFGTHWGVIVIPESWMPQNRRLICDRICDLRVCFADSVSASPDQIDAGLAEVLRICLVMYLAPGVAGKRGMKSPMAMNTWTQKVKCLVRVAKKAFEKSVDLSNLKAVSSAELFAATSSVPQFITTHILEYRQRGWIGEFPLLELESSPRGKTRERSRKGKERLVSTVKVTKEFQPFNDAFVAMAGYRCIWLIRTLGPTLVDMWEGLLDIKVGSRNTVYKYQNLFVQNWDWRAGDGKKIDALPFFLGFRGGDKRQRQLGESFTFRPRNRQAAQDLLAIVQGANLFVLLLSTASRAGEVASFTDDCLQEAPDGEFRAAGKTFKFVFNNVGADRDWPLPDVAVEALLLQQRIAKLVKNKFPVGSKVRKNALWMPFQASRSKLAAELKLENLPNFSVHCTICNFVQKLGVSVKELGNPHPHRFRKTLARLIALAIINSPQVVMDLFGHKTIEMALRYIHADKTLRAEILRVAEDLRLLSAKSIVEGAETHGGPAAVRIREAVQERVAKHGQQELAISDSNELATLFALSDTSLQLVRPGVFCLKSPSQPGPCTRRVGHPDPSRCKVSCESRLELGFLRSDVDGAIAEAVDQIERLSPVEDPMLVEWWIGQLLTQLPRFDDLRAKWSVNPTVISLLAAVQVPVEEAT